MNATLPQPTGGRLSVAGKPLISPTIILIIAAS